MEWVGDEVANFFFRQLFLRDHKLARSMPGHRKSSFFLTSLFYTKLTNECDLIKDGVYEYSNVMDDSF